MEPRICINRAKVRMKNILRQEAKAQMENILKLKGNYFDWLEINIMESTFFFF